MRPWCWERLKAGGEGDDRGWDSWVSSLTWWTWVWARSQKLVMDREAWHAAVHGVTKSWTWLSNWTATTPPSGPQGPVWVALAQLWDPICFLLLQWQEWEGWEVWSWQEWGADPAELGHWEDLGFHSKWEGTRWDLGAQECQDQAPSGCWKETWRARWLPREQGGGYCKSPGRSWRRLRTGQSPGGKQLVKQGSDSNHMWVPMGAGARLVRNHHLWIHQSGASPRVWDFLPPYPQSSRSQGLCPTLPWVVFKGLGPDDPAEHPSVPLP